MALPNLSNSMYVARLRYIQSIHESPDRRNPDTLVRHFIPFLERLRASWVGREELARLRADPFYYFLVARTMYYDRVIDEAVSDGVQRIISIGCGSDTRAYRFVKLLCEKGVKVLECDQSEAIRAKQRLARRWARFQHVQYLPIDLNDDEWEGLWRSIGDRTGPRTLVLMEGVSPYVNDDNFSRFLSFITAKLPACSHVAYDFKIRGVKDDFGSDGRTRRPFRLSSERREVEAFHRERGLQIEHMELSSELCARLLPGFEKSAASLFGEDVLVQFRVK